MYGRKIMAFTFLSDTQEIILPQTCAIMIRIASSFTPTNIKNCVIPFPNTKPNCIIFGHEIMACAFLSGTQEIILLQYVQQSSKYQELRQPILLIKGNINSMALCLAMKLWLMPSSLALRKYFYPFVYNKFFRPWPLGKNRQENSLKPPYDKMIIVTSSQTLNLRN